MNSIVYGGYLRAYFEVVGLGPMRAWDPGQKA